MVKPIFSSFRMITAKFFGDQKFRNFMVLKNAARIVSHLWVLYQKFKALLLISAFEKASASHSFV